MSATGIPLEAYAFLGAVAAFLVLLVLFFMYLNKLLCFQDCGGFPCIDKPPKKASKGNKLGTAYGNYDDQDTSSDSDDEVLRRYQQSIKRVPSSRSIRSSASQKSATKSHKSASGGSGKASSEKGKMAEQDKLMTDVEKGSKYGVNDVSPNGAEVGNGSVNGAKTEPSGGPETAKIADRSQPAVCNLEPDVSPTSPKDMSSPEVHDNVAYAMDLSPTEISRSASRSPDRGSHVSTEQALSAFGDTPSMSLVDQDEHLFDVSDLQDREPILISKCGTLEVSFTYNATKGQMLVAIHQAREIRVRIAVVPITRR